MNDSPRRSSDSSPPPTAAAPGTFSLRGLMRIALVLAILFAGIGYWTRDWPARQVLALLVLVVGWTVIIGLIAYVRMFRRRAVVRNLGPTLLRIKEPLISTFGGISTLLMLPFLAVIFFLPQFWLLGVVFQGERMGVRLTAEVVFGLVFYIVLAYFFINFMAQFMAQPNRIELFQHGFIVLIIPGDVMWDQVRSSCWRHEPAASKIVFVVESRFGKESTALMFDIPKSRIEDVDKVLSHVLKERHTPLDSASLESNP